MKQFAFLGSIAIFSIVASSPSLASEAQNKPNPPADPHQGFYIELGIGYRSRGKSDWSNKSLSASGTDFWHDSLARSFAFGYRTANGWRLSLGYKPFGWKYDYYLQKGVPGRNRENFSVEGKTYVFDLYKDFTNLKIGGLIPYLGVGIGASNLVFPKATRPAFVIDQLHTEVAAGLTYPMKNLELFAEALYGGVGKTVYGFHDGKSAIEADNLRTFSYTAGIRVPF